MGTFANSEDPDEMRQNAAFHQGLHFLLRSKQLSGTEMQYNLKILTCDPLNYTMDSPILIAFICMGNPSEYKGLTLILSILLS